VRRGKKTCITYVRSTTECHVFLSKIQVDFNRFLTNPKVKNSRKDPENEPEKICGPELENLAPMRSKWTGKFDVWTGYGPEGKKKERPREGRSL